MTRRVLILIFAALGAFTSAYSQTDSSSSSDQSLRSNARVNPSTLGMEMTIPLGNYPGRGPGVPVNLSYSSKLWRFKDYSRGPTIHGIVPCYQVEFPLYSEQSASGWTSGMAAPYIEYTGRDTTFNENGFPINAADAVCYGGTPYEDTGFIRRITVHLPGGETHELRADDTFISGHVGLGPTDDNSPLNQANWNTTFYAADGSNLKYVEDAGTGTFRLFLTDGTTVDFVDDFSTLYEGYEATIRKAETLTDRHGNTITYHAPTETYPNGYQTDTMGRTIAVPIGIQAPDEPTSSGSPQEYTLPGLDGGDPMLYKLHWKELKGASSGESGLTNFSDTLCYRAPVMPGDSQPSGCRLFETSGLGHPAWAPDIFNPIVLKQIELPNGASYFFGYDIYGRINKVTYPTGAVETFTYSLVPVLSPQPIWIPGQSNGLDGKANFGVTHREVVESSGATPIEWDYSAETDPGYGYKITTTAPDDTYTVRYMYRGNEICELCEQGTLGYDSPLAGYPYEERSYSSDDVLMSKSLTTYASTDLTIDGPVHSSVTAGWHPRTTQTESVVYDGTDPLAAITTSEYDSDLSGRANPANVRKVKQYDFSTTIGTTGALKKTVETDYVTDSNYIARNMVSLPSETRVKDGSTVVAKTQFSYDEVGTYPLLTSDTSVASGNWTDPVTNYRGLVTTTKSWTDIANNLSIQTHAQYDQLGNLRKSWDANGNLSQSEYSSTYDRAYSTKTISPIPDTSGTYGLNDELETAVTYDYNTGLKLTVTEPNGGVTSTEYDDPLLRQTKVTTPNGAEIISEYGAGTSNSTNWVKVKSQIDSSNWKEAYKWFDGLGRTTKTQSVDPAGDVFGITCYDTAGRVSKVSNPFRNVSTPTCSSTTGVDWTTKAYDTAGRLSTVTTADTAVVTTAYSLARSGSQIGSVVTATDAAGKLKRDITNALGQLIRVDEPNSSNALGSISSPNQPTIYTYNTNGGMVRVQQADQNRFFQYDAMGRTLRVFQPEQEVNTALNTSGNPNNNSWTSGSTYDSNGNVLTTTDAKGTTITSTYDKINRPVTRTYSDSTPTVTNYYDGTGLSSVPGYSKGKLTKVSNSNSDTKFTSFDVSGHNLESKQVTDGQTYTSSYQYDLGGDLIQETYPSGRVVNQGYNSTGDINRIYGKPTSSAPEQTYATGITYTPDEKIENIKLGNGVWESAKFNVRRQVTELAVGHSVGNGGLLKLSYEYGELQTGGSVDTTKNSGNIGKQTVNFDGLANPFIQTYKYDYLNRITESIEKVNGSQTWKQTYGYDVYGNRTSFYQIIGSTVLTINNVSLPGIESTTNRFSTSQGYTYDKNGNITADPVSSGRTFVFNGDNKQTEVKDSGSVTIGTYLYDGSGKRVKKVTDLETTVFVYDGFGKLAAEYSTATPPSSPTIHYTATDKIGSPRVLTDKLGQIVSRRDFLPFGEELFADGTTRTSGAKYSTSSQDAVRQRFAGYQNDLETGLDFAEARYYKAEHGRFTAVDPLLASGKSANPQTFNRYVYTMNRPLSLIDSTGMQSATRPQKSFNISGYTYVPETKVVMISSGGVGGGKDMRAQTVLTGKELNVVNTSEQTNKILSGYASSVYSNERVVRGTIDPIIEEKGKVQLTSLTLATGISVDVTGEKAGTTTVNAGLSTTFQVTDTASIRAAGDTADTDLHESAADALSKITTVTTDSPTTPRKLTEKEIDGLLKSARTTAVKAADKEIERGRKNRQESDEQSKKPDEDEL